jgi:hypothetical protein
VLCHCERVFLAFRQEYRNTGPYRRQDFRQSKENAVNPGHVPNPSALAIRAALAKLFRFIPHNFKKQFAIRVVVRIRRHDLLSRNVAIWFIGEQIGQRDSKGGAYFFGRTPRLAVNQSSAIVARRNGKAWRLVRVSGASGHPTIGGSFDVFQPREDFSGGHVRASMLTCGSMWVYSCINE